MDYANLIKKYSKCNKNRQIRQNEKKKKKTVAIWFGKSYLSFRNHMRHERGRSN